MLPVVLVLLSFLLGARAQCRRGVGDNPISCLECDALLWLVDQVVESNKTIEEASKLAIDYCRTNSGGAGYHCTGEWQCKDLCTGAVDEFAKELIDIATTKLFNPSTDCRIFGYCPANDETTTTTTNAYHKKGRSGPKAILPPKSSARTTKNDGVIRILQVTDIHFDPDYKSGTWTQCGQPMCCRDVPYSNMTLTPTSIAGTYGDYNCDSPMVLLETLMDALAGVNPPPQFGFLTGDDPPHNVWNQTREYNINASFVLMKMIQNAMPATTFFPALGNHNGYPINQYNVDVSVDKEWLYGPLSSLYAPWLNEEERDQFTQGGFYVARINDNLNVIVINSNFHDGGNFWIILDEGDVAGMFTWLFETLTLLRSNNQRAYYLQHHPFGELMPNASLYLTQLLTSFDDVIVAFFLGHTHHDEFFVMTKGTVDAPVPSLAGFIPGAGTPGSQNPMFRIYDVDASTGDILDFYHYRADLDKQGLINNNSTDAPKPQWNLIYQATQAYDLSSLSAASWYNAANSMFSNDTLFQFYFDAYSPGTMGGNYTPQQRVEMICNIIGVTTEENKKCVDNHPTDNTNNNNSAK